MEYLIGLLSGVVFFIVLIIGVFIGTRLNNTTKRKPPDVTDEEKQRVKQFNEDFTKVMEYNEHTARQRKG